MIKWAVRKFKYWRKGGVSGRHTFFDEANNVAEHVDLIAADIIHHTPLRFENAMCGWKSTDKDVRDFATQTSIIGIIVYYGLRMNYGAGAEDVALKVCRQIEKIGLHK